MNIQTIIALELELSGLLYPDEKFQVIEANGEQFVYCDNTGFQPKYCRDNGQAFKLMVDYGCTPDRSSTAIPLNEGWVYVPGTSARLSLSECLDLMEAYRIVIVMAVIEKLK